RAERHSQTGQADQANPQGQQANRQADDQQSQASRQADDHQQQVEAQSGQQLCFGVGEEGAEVNRAALFGAQEAANQADLAEDANHPEEQAQQQCATNQAHHQHPAAVGQESL